MSAQNRSKTVVGFLINSFQSHLDLEKFGWRNPRGQENTDTKISIGLWRRQRALKDCVNLMVRPVGAHPMHKLEGLKLVQRNSVQPGHESVVGNGPPKPVSRTVPSTSEGKRVALP